MLHGKTIIELQDNKTGEVTRRVDHNMVTNALSSRLNENLFGSMNRLHVGNANYNSVVYNYMNSGPIQTVAMGGLALFDQTLTENANVLFERAPISYASSEVYSGINNERGSINASLSQKITNGYRWVYDFSAERANHTFRSLGLTSRVVGRGPATSDVTNQYISEIDNFTPGGDSNYRGYFVCTQSADDQLQLCYGDDYLVGGVGTNANGNFKYDLPSSTKLNFNDVFNVDTAFNYSAVATTNLEGWVAPDPKGSCFYIISNSGNSSGNATLTINKYSAPDFATATTTTLTVSAPLYPHRNSYRIACRDGYVYMPSYDGNSVYKINLTNAADVTQFSIAAASIGTAYLDRGTSMIGNVVTCGYGMWFPDGTFWATNRRHAHNQAAFGILTRSDSSVWGMAHTAGSWEKAYFRIAPSDLVLYTKNNLSEPVTKTSSQTMRITYELTYGA